MSDWRETRDFLTALLWAVPISILIWALITLTFCAF